MVLAFMIFMFIFCRLNPPFSARLSFWYGLLGMMLQYIMENKNHVPNHQSAILCSPRHPIGHALQPLRPHAAAPDAADRQQPWVVPAADVALLAGRNRRPKGLRNGKTPGKRWENTWKTMA